MGLVRHIRRRAKLYVLRFFVEVQFQSRERALGLAVGICPATVAESAGEICRTGATRTTGTGRDLLCFQRELGNGRLVPEAGGPALEGQLRWQTQQPPRGTRRSRRRLR